ncbi:MAG TPA: ABC transporter ATP-binding protein [Clostridiales bacterium]|nr:ABC transporter ATP-binding protein [Clostridiales bacterium]
MLFGKHINKFYIKYGLWLLLGIATLFAVDYFQLLIPECYRMVINGVKNGVVDVGGGVTETFDLDFLFRRVCVPMFVVIVVMVFGRFLWRMCFFGSGSKVERDLRRKMFDKAKNLSVSYYQREKIGNLMSLFTNDLETVQDCFGSGILMAADAILLGTMSLYKMFVMDWVLTLFTLIPIGLMFAAGMVVGHYMEMKWDERQKAFSDLSDFAQESFSGIAVIKAFVKEFKELLAFKRLNKNNEKANVSYVKASALLNTLVSLFVESVVCIILGYGGYLVYQGKFDAGELMEFIGYFNAIIWPVMSVTELIEMSSRGRASLKRVSELLDAVQEVDDKPTATDVTEVTGKIEFRHLTFRYPDGDYEALSDVSFTINPGESVGIVGKTGSGKTTVADLILRCYNVPDGTLLIDDKDVNDITIHSLRNFCAYVPQDNFLFSDTIADNISFASDTDERALVERSAALADVDDNIREFANGYDTVLGERGVTVSGGQKQRISIARALMKEAAILILDDSVSAVDTDTERVILDNLRQTRKGKTTLLVAHRVTTVQNLDKIVYLDGGKVLDVGTHEQLVARCDEYRNMVELQKLDEEEDNA